jgi:ligand-binding sensor domain-containing protein
MKQLRISLLIAFNLLLTRLLAQPEFSFRNLGLNEGLSQNTINAICQDHRGFIWLGTFDGLNRYDGYSFKVYRSHPEDEFSLRNSSIFSLFLDTRKTLWVGTMGGGLHRYDDDRDGFIWIDIGQEKNVIRCMLEDKNGLLWVGTNEGIIILDAISLKVQKRFIHNPGDPGSIGSNTINHLASDNQGNIWIATENNGLDYFDTKRELFSHFTHTGLSPFGLPDNYIIKLLADPDGTLWVGTRSNGLLHFFPDRKEFMQVPFRNDKVTKNALPHHFVTCIIPEKSGQLLIGTLGGGLSLMNRKDLIFSHMRHSEDNPASLSKNAIKSVFLDRDNNLWVGTEGGGLNFHDYKRKKFGLLTRNPSDPNSLGNKSVLSMVEDPSGVIWIGTDEGGLNAYDPKSGKVSQFPIGKDKSMGVSQHVITELIIDDDSRLWIGTSSAGISILPIGSKKFTYLDIGSPSDGGLSSSWIFCLFRDSRKRMWVGTNGGGLNMLEYGINRSVHYMHNPFLGYSISNDYITDIYEDSRQVLWVATWEGLNIFDEQNKVFRRYMNNPADTSSVSSNEITCIYEDSRKRLWIGTYAGLNRFNPEDNTFRRYSQRDGMPNNVICYILEDDSGNLWISTFMGVTCFNPEKETFRNFDVTDGLQGNQFNPRSGLKSSLGILYFGGMNGISYFIPDSIYQNTTPPRIEFTGFNLFNRPVRLGEDKSILKQSIWNTKEIKLKHNQSTFSFEFVAINYSSSAKCNYRYKLDNFDTDWIENHNSRTANYTNIPPGSYVFRVIASNNDNIWNLDGISMRVIITPPFWKTWYARGLLILTLAFMILLAHYLRVYQIKDQKAKLENQVHQRTRELVQQKEELERQAHLLEEANTEIIKKNIHLEDQKEEIKRQSVEIKRINSLLRIKNESLTLNVKEISKARVDEKIVSFEEFRGIYPDDEACYELIRAIKQHSSFECKNCKTGEYSAIHNGKYIRRCKKCGYRETVTDHTIFFQVKFPIVKAFYILYLVSSGRRLTADELSGLLSLRRETCWAFRSKVLAIIETRKGKINPSEGWKELILVQTRQGRSLSENKDLRGRID